MMIVMATTVENTDEDRDGGDNDDTMIMRMTEMKIITKYSYKAC